MEENQLTSLASLFEEVDEAQVETETQEKEEEVETKETEEVEEVENKEEVKEEEEQEETEIDLNSAKTFYNYLKEIQPLDDLPEGEEPTLEFLREQQDKLPEKYFLGYVDSRPDVVKEFLRYQANFDNPTVEDLSKFWSDYIVQETTYDTTTIEGARQYLKNRPEFAKMYKTAEKIDAALDILEDDGELLDRAKELETEESLKKEELRKEKIRQAEEAKQARLEGEKRFASELQKTANEFQWKPERKQKALREINPKSISSKWEEIHKNPKALIQFADFLSYYDGKGFDAFYNLIEGKEKSKETVKTKQSIEKDSLGKLLGTTKPKENRNYRSLEEDFG